MEAILTGASNSLCRLKTGFWYSGVGESAAHNLARGFETRAAPAAAVRKLRRFILSRITRSGCVTTRRSARAHGHRRQDRRRSNRTPYPKNEHARAGNPFHWSRFGMDFELQA